MIALTPRKQNIEASTYYIKRSTSNLHTTKHTYKWNPKFISFELYTEAIVDVAVTQHI